MNILILDDMEKRHEGFKYRLVHHNLTHCYTYKEAIKSLSEKVFDVVYLDHDLNEKQTMGFDDGEKTGYDVALFIARAPKNRQPHQIIIHSWNPEGARRMEQALQGLGIQVFREPFKYL